MKTRLALAALFLLSSLADCIPITSATPEIQSTIPPVPTDTVTAASSPNATDTPVPTNTATPTETGTSLPTPTASPTNTPTEIRPLTLVFYGDSTLKVGEVGNQGHVGFSFVDNLRKEMGPNYDLITANYGGKTAKWGYLNLERTVLSFNPNVVTLVWGWNDLLGCPGIFDRQTNSLLKYKLVALIKDHIKYMRLQIDALLLRGSKVFVVTPFPCLGSLPWDHLGPNNEDIWELDYRCDYNTGMEQLAEAERQLVMEYSVGQKPVYLVDAWKIYKDHPNSEKMYMDIMHPASHGVALIAEGWLQAFKDSQNQQP